MVNKMLITKEVDFLDFEPSQAGEDIKKRIIESEKKDEFEEYICMNFPYGISEEELNDLLINQYDMLFDVLEIAEKEYEEGKKMEKLKGVGNRKGNRRKRKTMYIKQ